MSDRIYLNALGMVNCLGRGKEQIADALYKGDGRGLTKDHDFLRQGQTSYVGQVDSVLDEIPEQFDRFNTRNNRLLETALSEIRADVDAVIAEFGPYDVAVVIGTSTSGIAEGEQALLAYKKAGYFPEGYHFEQHMMGNPVEYLVARLALGGMQYCVTSACSSSAKAFEVARLLLEGGLAKAVIVGGVDSLCKMTVQGFHALGALSPEICCPFSANRQGTTIGEGAALFLMSYKSGEIEFRAVGESSDAYSAVAPEPEGRGAEAAMRDALKKASLTSTQIDYLNLHGTGTHQNDSAESRAVSRVFGPEILCSSTKPLTGHTLGAAGATEVGLCWLTLQALDDGGEGPIPPHVWDGQVGEDIDLKRLNDLQISPSKTGYVAMMSNSFAFGGSNASVIIGKKINA